MADPLYLSLWFPSFESDDMLPRILSVIRQFPFSAQKPGVTALGVHPVSWSEPTILERRFNPGIDPEPAIEIASDLLHEDYAYAFQAYWDLWSLPEGAQDWVLQPSPVRFIAHGLEFDERAFEHAGNVQVDFGL